MLLEKFVNSDIYFKDKKSNELTQLYSLFYRLDDRLQHMIENMVQCIRKEGEFICEANAQKPLELIAKLLHLRGMLESQVSECFRDDMRF